MPITLRLCCSHAAGDVLMVQPSNLPDVVQEFITHLALEPDQLFLLEQNDPGKLFTKKVSYCFHCLDCYPFPFPN